MMNHVAFTRYVDVAQVTLYGFWVFFFGLVYYLRREDKREGYPLVSEIAGHTEEVVSSGLPPVPRPKRFRLFHGGDAYAPQTEPVRFPVNAVPAANFPGAPLEPTGNPLVDGLGPAAWAPRKDEPDLTIDGKLKIVPMRSTPEYELHRWSLDPRGMVVLGTDKGVVGTVVDIWLDEVEESPRYFEVELSLPGVVGDRVLIPAVFATFRRRLRQLIVRTINAAQFADVPRLRTQGQVTRLEEDKLVGYFGGGLLYGSRYRAAPLV